MAAATEFFAEHGFGGTTRELAERLGVTQALLYKYFPSKADLVDRVYAALFASRPPGPAPLLADRSLGLEERLTRFYVEMQRNSRPTVLRLWIRAGLEGLGFAERFSAPLTARVLAPIVAALREAAGLPGFDRRPLMRGEREVAMMFHGGVVFLSIRKHVYRMPLPDDLADVVALQVRTLLPGALRTVATLHSSAAPTTLTAAVGEGTDMAASGARPAPSKRV